jgi:hypothetical protein
MHHLVRSSYVERGISLTENRVAESQSQHELTAGKVTDEPGNCTAIELNDMTTDAGRAPGAYPDNSNDQT